MSFDPLHGQPNIARGAICQASPLETILSRLVMAENGTDTKQAWPGHLRRANALERRLGAVTEPSGADLVRLNALVERQRRDLDELRSATAARSVVDLARGMLMEQLGCTSAEAQRQLVRLAAESGITATELAAQITHTEPPGEPLETGMPRISLARAAIETAASGNAVAKALLGEALGSLGVVAVAIWLTEPDGGLELAGEAGF